MSIGDTVFDIKDIRKSYKVANDLKKYILTEGTNKCIYKENIRDIKEKKMNFKEEIDYINKLIIEKSNKDLEKYISEILENKELTPKNIYDFSIKIIILIDDISNEFKLEKKYGRDSLSNTIIELCNESTRKSVKAFIIREIEELIEAMYKSTVKYSPVVQQIVNIVDDRYYEELSLKILAHQYNINSSYLGQIFSKETGSSFSEYLNKTKNMKAKELILNTNMKINDIAKKGNSQIQVKDLIELDARLKSACQAALLERDIYASPKWLSGTIDKEIRDARNIKNKTSKYLTTEEKNAFEKELRKATDVRRAKDVSYQRAAEGVYILRDYINELRAKHPQEFESVLALREGEAISWREFNVQSEIPDPARIAKIVWLNSPSFDFLPDGFTPSDNEEIIVGYGNNENKLQYGSYETYTNNRDRLRASEEIVAPDFGDEGQENNQTVNEGYIIFNFN
ncbi:MAG: CAMP factor (Cfa) [Anaerococcus sp.]|nr:CAMP factor (Cfa) [Anaerococcus sp.]